MSLDIGTYVQLSEGNQYFSTKVKSENWDQANNILRTKALKEASRLINNLNFKGCKLDPNQNLLFPRFIGENFFEDTPNNIKIACLEIAYALLDPTLDMELELEGLADAGSSFASVRADRNINIYHEHIRSGIPSALAWSYLKPFLIDPKDIHISKA